MTIKRKSSLVLVRPGQKWLTSDDAAARIAEFGFKAVAAELGVGESTLRLTMKEDGYKFTKKMIWQEPTLEGLDVPAGADEHQGDAREQEPVGAGGGE